MKTVNATKAHKLIELHKEKDDLVVLDVRSPAELESGKIEGAVNIDVSSPMLLYELQKLDKEKKYIVYCRSGARSAHAVQLMDGLGITDAYNLEGGVMSWLAEDLPLV